MWSERHRSNLLKDDFRAEGDISEHFEALDLIMASIRTKFNQSSFIAFSNLESYLIQSVKGQGMVDEEIVKYIREIYNEDLDEVKLQVEMDVLTIILADVNITCFADIYKKMKEIGKVEKSLIANAVVLSNLLIVKPATSCTPERSFSTSWRLKTCLRSTMTDV